APSCRPWWPCGAGSAASRGRGRSGQDPYVHNCMFPTAEMRAGRPWSAPGSAWLGVVRDLDAGEGVHDPRVEADRPGVDAERRSELGDREVLDDGPELRRGDGGVLTAAEEDLSERRRHEPVVDRELHHAAAALRHEAQVGERVVSRVADLDEALR